MSDPVLEALHELIAVTREKSADAWVDLTGVAEYLSISVEYARQEVVSQPDFPKPARVKGRNGHPRWLRSEIAAWMRSRQN